MGLNKTKMKLTAFVFLSCLILLTIGLYLVMVETTMDEFEESMNDQSITEEDVIHQEDNINFDEITIDDYCNTAKGRSDVFCKEEL